MRIKKNKKGVLGSFLVDFWVYIYFIVIIILFFTLFRLESIGQSKASIESFDADTSADIHVINFLRTPISFKEKIITIADMLSTIDLEENKEEKERIFQENAKEIFNKIYPSELPGNEIPYEWWVKVHSENEEPKRGAVGSGKYMSGIKVPGKGFQYSTGSACSPEGGQYSNAVSSINVPKINGGYIKIVFCVYK